MSAQLYQQDSYLREFSTQVKTVSDEGVVLERTAFFPSGGGVLGDTGTLREASGITHRVVETQDTPQGILHRIQGSQPATSALVQGVLDWPRRYLLMRYHTATHVLCGVMFRDHGVRVTGCQLTLEKGRVDFSFPAFQREALEAAFKKANVHVQENLPVRISSISATEAAARPELFKLEAGFRHELELLRLVEIVGLDIQADGGCHVRSTGEIGALKLRKTESKGRNNRRVYFELGDPL